MTGGSCVLVSNANGNSKPPTVTGVFLFQPTMNYQREFTGVFIPAHIWLSGELGAMEKMLLGEIVALSQKNGWCYATRKHFASWMHCSEANVTYYLTKLLKAGYIEQIEKPGFPTLRRVVVSKFYGEQEPVNVVDPYPSNVFTPTRQTSLPGGSNGFTLNTSINTISNTSNKEKEISASAQVVSSSNADIKSLFLSAGKTLDENSQHSEEKKEKKLPSMGRGAVTDEMPKVVQVIDYMNSVGCTKFRVNTGNTAKMVLARYKEGYTIEDFKKVIDSRFKAWNGTDMMQHFCPQTLFRPNNFEKYLQNAKFARPQASGGIGAGSDYSNWDESKKPF